MGTRRESDDYGYEEERPRRRRHRADEEDREAPAKTYSRNTLVLAAGITGAGALILGLVIGVMIGQRPQVGSNQTPHPNQAQNFVQAPGPAPAPAEAPGISVSAVQLINEYKANEAAANLKYRGKRLEIGGVVKRTTAQYVELSGDGFELITVDCFFDEVTLATFARGARVTISGVCQGKTPFAIEIKNCQKLR